MAVRVEFHNLPVQHRPRVMWLPQVPGVGEEVCVVADSDPQRVAHVTWDLTAVTTPSAHLNQVRADVYLEPL